MLPPPNKCNSTVYTVTLRCWTGHFLSEMPSIWGKWWLTVNVWMLSCELWGYYIRNKFRHVLQIGPVFFTVSLHSACNTACLHRWSWQIADLYAVHGHIDVLYTSAKGNRRETEIVQTSSRELSLYGLSIRENLCIHLHYNCWGTASFYLPILYVVVSPIMLILLALLYN